MTRMTAEARARAATPGALLARFCDHMAGHGLAIGGTPEARHIAFPGGAATLRLEPDGLALRIEAEDADRLADAKATVAGHLDAFAPGEALGIVWRGDGAAAADGRPHNFRALRLRAARDITPRMRRLTFAGPDLGRFEAEMLHVKLLIPEDGAGGGAQGEPRWPVLSPSGQAVFEGCALTRRTYTIRRIDAASGELDIDFVRHGDASPGSRFAARARPGDWLGITGPGGGTIPLQEWSLLAGDETALPAIARVLEAAPPAAQGVALIEVADAAEIQPLRHPPGFSLRWLPRDGAAHGAPLLQAVCATPWPEQGAVSAWAACEARTARALRERWGADPRLPRGQFRAAAYWREGLAEGAAQPEH